MALLLMFTTTSETILTIIYGREHVYLAPILNIGTVFIVFKFMNLSIGYTLTSANRQKQRAWAVLVGLIVTIVLVIVLVPSMGVTGAILALVISEVSLTFVLSLFVRDLFIWKNVALILVLTLFVAAISMFLTSVLFQIFNSSLQIVKGVVVSIVYSIMLVSVWSVLYSRVKGLS